MNGWSRLSYHTSFPTSRRAGSWLGGRFVLFLASLLPFFETLRATYGFPLFAGVGKCRPEINPTQCPLSRRLVSLVNYRLLSFARHSQVSGGSPVHGSPPHFGHGLYDAPRYDSYSLVVTLPDPPHTSHQFGSESGSSSSSDSSNGSL